MVEHIYNINTPEVEAEASIVQSQTLHYSELELDWLCENNSVCLSVSLYISLSHLSVYLSICVYVYVCIKLVHYYK